MILGQRVRPMCDSRHEFFVGRFAILRRMQSGALTVERIERQLEALRLQEQDALAALAGIAKTSATYAQLVRLLSRIAEDRERLNVALRTAAENRDRSFSWTEIAHKAFPRES